MHPYFIAVGPSIRRGVEIPPFNTVDLYSMWAYMLRISESDTISNGSLGSSAFDMLIDKPFDVSYTQGESFIVIVAPNCPP